MYWNMDNTVDYVLDQWKVHVHWNSNIIIGLTSYLVVSGVYEQQNYEGPCTCNYIHVHVTTYMYM